MCQNLALPLPPKPEYYLKSDSEHCRSIMYFNEMCLIDKRLYIDGRFIGQDAFKFGDIIECTVVSLNTFELVRVQFELVVIHKK